MEKGMIRILSIWIGSKRMLQCCYPRKGGILFRQNGLNPFVAGLKQYCLFFLALNSILTCSIAVAEALDYPIVDTGQNLCYSTSGPIAFPSSGQAYYGQDAQYRGSAPVYRDNGDGTVSDLTTGLMWQKGLNSKKAGLVEARDMAKTLNLGGYADWRVPTIKELYSLIDFRGNTGFSGRAGFNRVPSNAVPYINTDYFDFAYGNVEDSERYIDAQWMSSTEYVSTTMDGMDTLFGVNFADGRIKGYGYRRHGSNRAVKTFYVRFVRGKAYGINRFEDNGDGTVTDQSTGLTWMQSDSRRSMSWQEALAFAENLSIAGHRDWRLPNAKELQSIVDYSRSPDSTGSPAIDPVFETTAITNEAGRKDYPFFWTSTTHLDGSRPGSMAVYVAFGRAIGSMRGKIMDVHGAGAQRSDPKTGSPALGRGPQGDAQRIKNFVRCVRAGTVNVSNRPVLVDRNHYPFKIRLVANLPGMPGPAAIQWQDSSFQRPGAGNPDRQFGIDHQHPKSSVMGMNFVRRLDKDGDGRVSRSEFDGPPDRFDFHDADHDGFLSEAEAPKHPPLRGAPRR